MRRLILAVWLGGVLHGQTVINGDRTLLGKWDASVATATIPFSVGAAANLPSSCAVGQMYFAADGPAGRKLYACAAGAWQPIGYLQGTIAAMPSACSPGDLYFATDATAGSNLYGCGSANTWTRIGGSGAVASVFGRTGAVTAQAGDYTKALVGLGNVDNTADIAKPVSIATQAALDGKMAATPGSGVLKVTAGAPGLVNGAPSDCVRVDGTSGGCGAAGNTPYSCSVTAASSITCTHNLGTWTPQIWCFDTGNNLLGSTAASVDVTSVTASSANAVAITFSAVTTGTCKIGTGGEGPAGPTGPQGPAGAAGNPGGVANDVEINSGGTTFAGVRNVTTTPMYLRQTGNGSIANAAAFAALAYADLPPGWPLPPCEIIVGDPGSASPVLADDNDTPHVCTNEYGRTISITGVHCYAPAGSPTVTPIVSGGSSTSILSGALTCSSSDAAGTLNGSPTYASGATLDANIATAGGAAKYLVIRISRVLQ